MLLNTYMILCTVIMKLNRLNKLLIKIKSIFNCSTIYRISNESFYYFFPIEKKEQLNPDRNCILFGVYKEVNVLL